MCFPDPTMRLWSTGLCMSWLTKDRSLSPKGSGTIPAISVTAGGGIAVQLKGLQVSAYIGIVFTGQGTLVIEDCTIQFGSLPVAYGIDFRPAGGASFM